MTGRGPVTVGIGIAAVVVAGWLAVVEVLWLPLRVGGVLVPVSVAAAVAGNLLLVGAALRLSGSKAVAALPAVTWLAVVVAAMVRRPEGDLLLVSGGSLGLVSTAFLLLGVLAAALALGLALGTPARRVSRAGPTGSGSGGAR
ncbi:hypothetical protein E9549_07885 [Blastococcus sp. MG754426]|uniref:hypothetical protein n=1 Tax=unclassified Blastococcus TaxID=2619396 RepID=UPI001EF0352B|nr:MULTISPECIES: hypothetical protein [unclassified Blastococcus]MCF6507327.1 hypothetical protein [Blastococcus sp. MG754426]MCF6511399.1 hypothetical protein [Blastococcus sp. MG754427]MCF6736848.1 hypothetical protein [Blastococcus sp. KM273129]